MAGTAALLLAGCAATDSRLPQVQQGVTADGVKTVAVAPRSLLCEQAHCPTLSAHWSSQRAGVVVLVIGLPFQTAKVSSADFHFGRSQVVRLRVASNEAAPDLGYPATAFDVPISLIDALAYKPDGWVRVSTDAGTAVQESVSTGEAQSDAVDGMRAFLHALDSATGTPPQARRGGAGLFDLLR
ncbi:hypothetical protein KUD94_04290 [Comamonas sp. NLF-1-9]|nr:hypothetical protein KUD94_04290 [Comamonas sp. NLF-1-9]